MDFHPTVKEEALLNVVRRYYYATVEQMMLATGMEMTASQKRMAQQRVNHLTPKRKKKEEEKTPQEVLYLWRIERRWTKGNLDRPPAYTLSVKSKTYLEARGKTVNLVSRNPSPIILDHALAVNDVLIRAEMFAKNHANTVELLAFQSDRELHRMKIEPPLPVVPDGLVDFKITTPKETTSYPTLFEIDMGTEWGADTGRWTDKIERYCKFLPKPIQKNSRLQEVFGYKYVTIAVIAFDTEKRVALLKKWTEQVLSRQKREDLCEFFYFTNFTRGMSAEELFTQPRYLIAGDSETSRLFDL